MPTVEIRDMDPADEYFVGTCSQVGESAEIDASSERRVAWFRRMYEAGLRVKTASVDGDVVGFLHVMPIEICPWGPLGRDLMMIPCLVVTRQARGMGVGQALMRAAEDESRRQGRKGVVSVGYYNDSRFMPAPFFTDCGYSVAVHQGDKALLWKVFDPSAETPRPLERCYQFEPVAGKVVVDLFWHTFCESSDMEAERVRAAVAEIGSSVVLREYCADDQSVLQRYQMPRGVFVNGREIPLGHEALKGGIREAISEALSHSS